jgi:D-glycero-D-manno-heptose 1,7-bisphosphate phosphatase
MRRAVFVDRDGVVNRAVIRDGRSFPPGSLAELEILPGVAEALAKLRAAGFLVIVATNQPDVGAGKQRREVVEAMHEHLLKELALDDIRVCYHVDADRCGCRKPLPGMLLEAARAWDIALGESFMVGDRWRDVEAGRAAGCRTAFVDYQLDEARPAADVVVDSLAAASRWILSTGPRNEPAAASPEGPGPRRDA